MSSGIAQATTAGKVTMRQRRRTFGADTRRRAVVLTLLVGQLWAATGLPLPAAAIAKDLSQPFPCMNNPCGCSSAEQCWRSCCCTTLAERLAWAREHGVEPPEYVREQVVDETADCDPSSSDCPHCKKRHACHERDAKPTGVRWILGIAARRCQGLGPMAFFADTPGLPAAPPLTIDLHRSVVAACAIGSQHPLAVAHPPPSPPPRSIG
jgi:hypothetical protein